jgi:hypothetical protein
VQLQQELSQAPLITSDNDWDQSQHQQELEDTFSIKEQDADGVEYEESHVHSVVSFEASPGMMEVVCKICGECLDPNNSVIITTHSQNCCCSDLTPAPEVSDAPAPEVSDAPAPEVSDAPAPEVSDAPEASVDPQEEVSHITSGEAGSHRHTLHELLGAELEISVSDAREILNTLKRQMRMRANGPNTIADTADPPAVLLDESFAESLLYTPPAMTPARHKRKALVGSTPNFKRLVHPQTQVGCIGRSFALLACCRDHNRTPGPMFNGSQSRDIHVTDPYFGTLPGPVLPLPALPT